MASLDDAELEGRLCKRTADQARGIPEAVFIEDAESLCQRYTAQEVVAKLQDLYTKYRYMQSSMATQKGSLKGKLPDITSAKDTVATLMSKTADGEETIITYQLSDNIYTRAKVPPTSTVCLWLGANCLLEYTLEEATELLTKNETNATSMLASIEEDLLFLRDQITTVEVNIARCHNYGVKVRQLEKMKEATAQPAPAPAPALSVKPDAAKPEEDADCQYAFTWKQQNDEVEVSVRVPAGKDVTKGDIKVTILPDSLRVEHQGTVLLEGKLADACRPDDSTWTLVRRRVEISLQKIEAKQWPSLFLVEE